MARRGSSLRRTCHWSGAGASPQIRPNWSHSWYLTERAGLRVRPLTRTAAGACARAYTRISNPLLITLGQRPRAFGRLSLASAGEYHERWSTVGSGMHQGRLEWPGQAWSPGQQPNSPAVVQREDQPAIVREGQAGNGRDRQLDTRNDGDGAG